MPDLEREYAFLSYAHEDLEKVYKVYEGLKKRKVNVWFDKKDIKKGRWKPQILKAISRSRDFVICLSNSAIEKTSGENPGFQDEELQTAWEFAREQDEKDFTIIPVRLEDCGRGDMRLSGWQQYDLFEDWEGVLDTLAVNLGGKSLSDASAKDERTEDEKIVSTIMGKGVIFFYSGEYNRSLSSFEAAINIKPYLPEALYNRGLALEILGRPEEAYKSMAKAIVEAGGYISLTKAIVESGGHISITKAIMEAGGYKSIAKAIVEAGGHKSIAKAIVEAEGYKSIAKAIKEAGGHKSIAKLIDEANEIKNIIDKLK